uniref:Uncharacterized protein n=1 Tax=Periophthalmus magnuspinnatus TaxID=409849 RepID=A0A3B4ASA8_9GOBI
MHPQESHSDLHMNPHVLPGAQVAVEQVKSAYEQQQEQQRLEAQRAEERQQMQLKQQQAQAERARVMREREQRLREEQERENQQHREADRREQILREEQHRSGTTTIIRMENVTIREIVGYMWNIHLDFFKNSKYPTELYRLLPSIIMCICAQMAGNPDQQEDTLDDQYQEEGEDEGQEELADGGKREEEAEEEGEDTYNEDNIEQVGNVFLKIQMSSL